MDDIAPSALLSLPSELRQRVLQLALKQDDTIELQHPVWYGQGIFFQPLFSVCHLLRSESLQAFYEVNTFLWIMDHDLKRRSDPADYPLARGYDGDEDECPHVLTPTLPWEYPDLMVDLRCLYLNIYLPSDGENEQWTNALPRRLERLVNVLDRGSRLSEFHVEFTAARFNAVVSLTGNQSETLDVLAGMQVRGKVRVGMRHGFEKVKAGIGSLKLDERMKA